jgi:FKBP-type peptidyl-prolyl cis-trans isomerase
MKTFALAMLFASASAIKVEDDHYKSPEGWVNSDPRVDTDRMTITVTKPGSGKTCAVGDWVTFHYKAYLKTSGRKVADTHQTGQGLPLTIALGQGQTFRCFEVGFTKLTEGTTAVLNCPYDMAWGNAFTWPAIGGEPIPLHSDIDFVAEI